MAGVPAVYVRVRPGLWFAFSRTTHGRRYRIEVAYTAVAGWAVVCNCPGNLSHGHCKHAREVLMKEYEEIMNDRAVARRQNNAPQHYEPLPVPKLDEGMKMQVSTILPSPADTVAMAQIANLMTKPGEDPKETFKTLLAGWELGVGPMTALRRMFTVRGKIEPDTQLMLALALAKDPSLKVSKKGDSRQCTVIVSRRGITHAPVQYTIEDANRSGQTKVKTVFDREKRQRIEIPGPWQLYTADMLGHSAMKRALKLYAPDLINNVKGVSLGQAEAMISPEDDVIDEIEAVEHAATREEPEQPEAASGDAPEPEADEEWEDTTDYKATLLALLQDAMETSDAEFFASLMAELRERYVYALVQPGPGKKAQFQVAKLTDEHAKDAVALIRQRVYGEAAPDADKPAPPADGDAEIDESEQPSEEAEELPTA